MAITSINNEDRLVQKTFADYLHQQLGWESVYAWNDGTFGSTGTLSAKEMAIFDLLKRDTLTKADRERLKQASKALLLRIRDLLAPMDLWARNAQTQAEVQTSILDWLYETLPQPPFTEKDTSDLTEQLYEHVWQQSEAGQLLSGTSNP